MENDKIQWGSILTNTLSTIVAAIIISAGAVIWKSAATIDSKIDLATADLGKQQKKIEITQDVLSTQIARLTTQVQILEKKLQTARKMRHAAANGTDGPPPPPAQVAVDTEELNKKNFKEINELFQEYDKKRIVPMEQNVYQLQR